MVLVSRPETAPDELVEHKFQVLPMSLVEHKLFNIKNISLKIEYLKFVMIYFS